MKTNLIILTIIMLFLVACQTNTKISNGLVSDDNSVDNSSDVNLVNDDGSVDELTESWRTIELKDVETGNTFTIAQFDKPTLIESFAVWCPTCKKQQDKIKALHDEIGDGAISISLDTDPNENENAVKEHYRRYGYDWLFAVSPAKLSQSLIEDFGISVVNAPSAPVILVCPTGNARLLRRGVKSVSELKGAIGEC